MTAMTKCRFCRGLHTAPVKTQQPSQSRIVNRLYLCNSASVLSLVRHLVAHVLQQNAHRGQHQLPPSLHQVAENKQELLIAKASHKTRRFTSQNVSTILLLAITRGAFQPWVPHATHHTKATAWSLDVCTARGIVCAATALLSPIIINITGNTCLNTWK